MEQIRRNTTEFGRVAELMTKTRHSAQRHKLIYLYSLKPGETLEEAVLINKLKKDAAAIYNLSYESILQHFDDKKLKLYRESNKALYYFKASLSDNWIRFPFEFRGKLKKDIFPLSLVK